MSTPAAPNRRRKSPTASQLGAWRAFIETSESLKNLIAARMQTDSGLSMPDYSVLLALSESDHGRMRSSHLAEHIGWERSRLSHHLGRMERRGLITREAATGDSRGADIVLSDLGAQSFRNASSPHLHAVADLYIAGLSDQQLHAVADAMRTLQAHLDSPQN